MRVRVRVKPKPKPKPNPNPNPNPNQTWFCESRSHIAAMSPVEMKVVSEGSAAVGACQTVVSSVFGMQLWKSVRSSGSSQLRLSIASSWRSTSAEWKVRWAAGPNARGHTRPQRRP